MLSYRTVLTFYLKHVKPIVFFKGKHLKFHIRLIGVATIVVYGDSVACVLHR